MACSPRGARPFTRSLQARWNASLVWTCCREGAGRCPAPPCCARATPAAAITATTTTHRFPVMALPYQLYPMPSLKYGPKSPPVKLLKSVFFWFPASRPPRPSAAIPVSPFEAMKL